jgi:hypothetical protein
MIVLFLDIDGVCNSLAYAQRNGMNLWNKVDPEACELVRQIIEATGCQVVLSSTWRLYPDSLKVVREQVCEFIDVTPNFQTAENHRSATPRGNEIQDWLDRHPGVERYAILDDDSDMLPGQHLFQTTFAAGLTPEIAAKVIKHLQS